jgi:guanosine-3',5'-bis(diphosphate) 3'-pyrophosphohydrolase
MAHDPFDPSRQLAAANWFAAKKHGDQRRSDSHAFWLTVVDLGKISDMTIQLAGILRDVLENTPTTPAELEKRFGPDVRRVVEELTVDPGLDQATRRALELKAAPGLSAAAKIIRLADKIINLRALRVDWTLAENREYIDWVEKVGRAVRGVNARLDCVFDQMLKRARRRLRRAGRGPWPPATARGQLARKLPPAVARGLPKPDRRRDEDHLLKILAQPGVGSLVITRISAHRATVRIDECPVFVLPEVSAQLLWVLAFFGAPGEDGMSSWLSKRVAWRALGCRVGRTYERHSFDVALDRLQKKLKKNGVNPKLVDECPNRGVRFRLHVTPEPVAEPEPGELVTVS